MPASVKTYVNTILNVVRQLYAYLGTLESVTNVGGLPPKVRIYLGTTAGALLVFEHVLQALQNPAKAIQHTTTYVAPTTPPTTTGTP